MIIEISTKDKQDEYLFSDDQYENIKKVIEALREITY